MLVGRMKDLNRDEFAFFQRRGNQIVQTNCFLRSAVGTTLDSSGIIL